MTVFEYVQEKCADECSLQSRGSWSTCMGWSPTYDKFGNPTSFNPNTITTEFYCSKCGKTFRESCSSNGTIVEEI